MTKRPAGKGKASSSGGLARAIDELNNWLEQQEVEPRVAFGKPVSAADVAKAEAKLGVNLPPSYVDFVTKHGPFHISGALTGRGEGNDTRLLKPADACKETLRHRKEMEQHEDEESQRILDDCIIFCADPGDEFFHLFVISSADARGEMPTRPWDYQDPGNNDPWHEGDGTFASVIEQLIETVRAHALDGDD